VTQDEANRLGEYIRDQRQRAGMTLRDLATLAEVDLANLHRIETGKVKEPSPRSLQRLSRHLDCDYEDLAAMAGYSLPEGLPELQVYLRTKYDDLSSEEIRNVEQYVRFLHQQHDDQGVGGGDSSR
jgi:HTH-type transcriptional regulator, competence development regulator